MAVRAIDMEWRQAAPGPRRRDPAWQRGRPRGAAAGRPGVRRRRWVWRGMRARAWAVLGLVALALVLAGHSAGAARDASAKPSLLTVPVAPGDTLWGMAIEHAPAGLDPRVWIFRTEALNRLGGAGLMAGQVLRLPPGSH